MAASRPPPEGRDVASAFTSQLSAALSFDMHEVFHMTTEGIKGRIMMLQHAKAQGFAPPDADRLVMFLKLELQERAAGREIKASVLEEELEAQEKSQAPTAAATPKETPEATPKATPRAVAPPSPHRPSPAKPKIDRAAAVPAPFISGPAKTPAPEVSGAARPEASSDSVASVKRVGGDKALVKGANTGAGKVVRDKPWNVKPKGKQAESFTMGANGKMEVCFVTTSSNPRPKVPSKAQREREEKDKAEREKEKAKEKKLAEKERAKETAAEAAEREKEERKKALRRIAEHKAKAQQQQQHADDDKGKVKRGASVKSILSTVKKEQQPPSVAPSDNALAASHDPATEASSQPLVAESRDTHDSTAAAAKPAPAEASSSSSRHEEALEQVAAAAVGGAGWAAAAVQGHKSAAKREEEDEEEEEEGEACDAGEEDVKALMRDLGGDTGASDTVGQQGAEQRMGGGGEERGGDFRMLDGGEESADGSYDSDAGEGEEAGAGAAVQSEGALQSEGVLQSESAVRGVESLPHAETASRVASGPGRGASKSGVVEEEEEEAEEESRPRTQQPIAAVQHAQAMARDAAAAAGVEVAQEQERGVGVEEGGEGAARRDEGEIKEGASEMALGCGTQGVGETQGGDGDDAPDGDSEWKTRVADDTKRAIEELQHLAFGDDDDDDDSDGDDAGAMSQGGPMHREHVGVAEPSEEHVGQVAAQQQRPDQQHRDPPPTVSSKPQPASASSGIPKPSPSKASSSAASSKPASRAASERPTTKQDTNNSSSSNSRLSSSSSSNNNNNKATAKPLVDAKASVHADTKAASGADSGAFAPPDKVNPAFNLWKSAEQVFTSLFHDKGEQPERFAGLANRFLRDWDDLKGVFQRWTSVSEDTSNSENLNSEALRAAAERQAKRQGGDDHKMSSVRCDMLPPLKMSSVRVFRVVQNKPEVAAIVTQAFSNVSQGADDQEVGWVELPSTHKDSYSWNMLWTWSKPKIRWEDLNVWQRVNHFQEAKQLSRKDCLKKNIARYRNIPGKIGEAFDILPLTFTLPGDYVQFCTEFAKRYDTSPERNYWIMKPAGSSRGRGIFVFNDISAVSYTEVVIVQRYVDRPMLLDGYKFDLRLYVCVTSMNPLECFIYKKGFGRLSSEVYSTDPQDMTNKYIHLTNSSINRHNPNSVQRLAIRQDKQLEGGSKISLDYLWKRLAADGVDTKQLWVKIKQVVLKTLYCVQDSIPGHPNSFELFGFDVLIDQDCKPWLIEVNASPALSRENELDHTIKNAMVADTIRLVDPPAFDRRIISDVLGKKLSEKVRSKWHVDKELAGAVQNALGGLPPRQYGETPRFMGEYECCAPSPEWDAVCKLHKKLNSKN